MTDLTPPPVVAVTSVDTATRFAASETLRSVGSDPIVRCFPQGALIVFDHDLRYVRAGGMGLADVGLSQEMLEGHTIFEVFPPVVVAQIEPLYRLALAGEGSTMDVPYKGRIYLMRLAPLRDEADRIIAGMGFTQDVTAARQSERALHESEQRFRVAFEHAPIGKALIDLAGRYEQVNHAMCEITGYSEGRLRELTVAELTHPDDLAGDTAGTERLLAGEITTYTIEKRFLTAGGEVIWVAKSASLVRRDDGAPLHLIAQIQDITDRKEHERVLAQERRRLREAQSIGRVGSWELDVKTKVRTWSDMLLELYGADPVRLTGEYEALLGCVHPDDRGRIEAATNACLRAGTPLHVRYRVNRINDGELRWFDARGEAQYENGQIVRLAGAVADVTEQVLAETQAEAGRDMALEASRLKSAFLATMSHEIRTPMNAVIGMTGLLLDTPLEPEQREFVETIRTSGDSLLCIINDILDYSKLEAGSLKLEHSLFDLRDCVESSIDLIAATPSASGLELICDVDPRCPSIVVGDVSRLRQVLVNLLSNAVKFTEHGEVLLSVMPEGQAAAQTRLRIAVSDTGIGIPADRLDGLFESFSQVDASTTRLYGGTGLGLAISKRLVEAMDGIIEVQSISGAGSTFTFSIVLDHPVATHRTPASPAINELKDRSVLIVAENPTSRRVLRQALQGWGVKVTEAPSGDAALSLLNSDARFDAALLDRKMPAICAEELAQTLRASATTHPPAVILLADRGNRAELEPHDLFCDVILKPVKNARLKESILRTLAPDKRMPSRDSPPAPDGASSRQTLSVLVAEDNAVNQRVTRLMLEKLGQHVDVVANGAEAVEAVTRVPYDVVFMDVQMPEMDGLAATRAIRSNMAAHRQPRIVALTASVLTEDREACTHAGMDDYLAKPLRRADLNHALLQTEQALKSSQRRSHLGSRRP